MKKSKLLFLVCLVLLFSLLLSFSVSAQKEGAVSENGSADDTTLHRPISLLSKIASGSIHTVYLVLLAIAAVILCFYGYGLLRYCLGLLTFISSIYLLYYLANALGFLVDAKEKIICILVSTLIGILLSAFAFSMTKFGAFFFVSAFSYLMLSGLDSARVSFAVLSVLIGILASLFVRVSVVTISSFVGGMLLGASVFGIIKVIPFPYIYIPVGLSLFVLGMAIQFSFAKTKSKKRDKRKEKRKTEEYEDEYEQ